MSFNVEEKHAVVGAAGPALGTLAVSQFDIDAMLTDVSDAVFEGDRAQAARYVGGAIAVAGVAAAGAAVFTGVDDTMGMVAISVGITLVTLGALIMLEANAESGQEA